LRFFFTAVLLRGVNFPRLDGLILNLCWEPRPGVSVFPGKVGEGVPGLDKESIVATLLRRLNAVTGLNEADIAAIRALPIIVRPWEAGRAIVSDGDRPTECCLVIEGFCVQGPSLEARTEILFAILDVV
jgi:hypothetical protein